MRWAIVGTMDEAPEIVAAWAAWHLAQGAAELHIYLDRANARTQALLAKLPKVFVTVCDVDFYRHTFDFKRPINHQRRQTKNATHAYQKCDVDYLIHMDADEYLIQHTSLSDELAALRHGVFLSIPNVERVFTSLDKPGAIFTRHFRVSTRDDPQLEAPSTDAEGITRSRDRSDPWYSSPTLRNQRNGPETPTKARVILKCDCSFRRAYPHRLDPKAPKKGTIFGTIQNTSRW